MSTVGLLAAMPALPVPFPESKQVIKWQIPAIFRILLGEAYDLYSDWSEGTAESKAALVS